MYKQQRQPQFQQNVRQKRQQPRQQRQFVEEEAYVEEHPNDMMANMGLVTALVGMGVIIAGGYWISRKMMKQSQPKQLPPMEDISEEEESEEEVEEVPLAKRVGRKVKKVLHHEDTSVQDKAKARLRGLQVNKSFSHNDISKFKPAEDEHKAGKLSRTKSDRHVDTSSYSDNETLPRTSSKIRNLFKH